MLKNSFWLFFLPCYICIRDNIAIVITVHVILCNSYLIKKVLFHSHLMSLSCFDSGVEYLRNFFLHYPFIAFDPLHTRV